MAKDDLLCVSFPRHNPGHVPILDHVRGPFTPQRRRIVLRRLSVDDLTDFQAYRCDPDVARYQGWEATSDSEARAFLDATGKGRLLQAGEWCQIGIAVRPDAALIGDIGICLSKDETEAEIGFSLNRQHQGKGLAGDAVRAAIQMVFDETPAHRVIGITDTRNLPSIRLLERLGFRKIDTLQSIFQGEACTEYVFALTRRQTAP